MVSKWKIKAALQKTISKFPQREKLNYLLQKHVTKGVRLDDEHFEMKIIHARDHIRYFNQYGHGLEGATVLELGTGWYPIVPISLYLSGVEKTISLDIQNWLNKKHLIVALQKFAEWNANGKLKEYLPKMDAGRWTILEKLLVNAENLERDELLSAINLEVRLEDARNLSLPDDSVAYICSNNTFEHIYPEVLKDILKEFKRVIYTEGVMSHFIDMSDHFAHSDDSITIYNFLQFDEKTWRKVDNKIQPQNRLRFRAYKDIYEALKIPFIEDQVRPGYLKDLLRQPISAEFSKYTPDELAESHGYLISIL